jgi:predicted Zn-dependent protease with MMP-like domain
MTKLSTVDQVVEVLGRQTLMDLLGVTTGSVSNWLKDGRFPDRASLYRAVRDECTNRGFALDERIFGGAAAESADAA